MPRAAPAGVNPAARLNFCTIMRNLFLRRCDAPAATTEYELSSALNRRKFCDLQLARPEFRTATFSKCERRDEWVDLFALDSAYFF
jgi:hypothetical protein